MTTGYHKLLGRANKVLRPKSTLWGRALNLTKYGILKPFLTLMTNACPTDHKKWLWRTTCFITVVLYLRIEPCEAEHFKPMHPKADGHPVSWPVSCVVWQCVYELFPMFYVLLPMLPLAALVHGLQPTRDSPTPFMESSVDLVSPPDSPRLGRLVPSRLDKVTQKTRRKETRGEGGVCTCVWWTGKRIVWRRGDLGKRKGWRAV